MYGQRWPQNTFKPSRRKKWVLILQFKHTETELRVSCVQFHYKYKYKYNNNILFGWV
jgi:hypothetical protein